MRTVKSPDFEEDFAEFFDEDAEGDLFRVQCPDCASPIALAEPGAALPEHALCQTPWNPFGLTVCPGSGRVVNGDGGTVVPVTVGGGDSAAVLVALPEGLDWRLQPFSHAQVGVPPLRQAA
ncbi:hypothetical protein [Streptomyces sp. NBC_01803]|uniref:hypothetical protein n=1 Tax=Streptomyces sp. NBC_01803 TaxID=2975946 RepID=UPI002DDAA422|nr:hypothetical protein [Streptomyces sp. NBC_01803]WSA47210.1 hypothetical protein OIE51_25335 [Streptomyces sp. NBC_01803]